MKLFTTLTAGLLLAGTMAFAQVTPQALASDYQAQGYSRVEIKTGPNQIKVEAIRGTTKTEVVYDRATGAILKTETESVRPGENTRPGVSIRERRRDFVRAGGSSRSRDERRARSDDDRGERGGKGRGRGRGGDDDRRGAHDDDDRDDDRRGRRGRDDDDDRGSRRGRGSDDGPGDDRGGRRGRGSDD